MPEEISEYPPHPVKRPIMFQGWERLTFLHWEYEADVIRRHLPPGVEIDTFDGVAWVGLTPFVVSHLRPPFFPAIPWISSFPEMNVRTYVRGPDGERGIWFFTLEADRLAAVVGARLSYGLPYRWAAMRVQMNSGDMIYSSHRHLGAATAQIRIRRKSGIRPNALERFLTARYRLYTRIAGRLAFAQVEHEPWPLEGASAIELQQDVIQKSGVAAPKGEPLVHFSPGTYVRIGGPTFVS